MKICYKISITIILFFALAISTNPVSAQETSNWYVVAPCNATVVCKLGQQFKSLDGPYDRQTAADLVAFYRLNGIEGVHAIPETAYCAQLAAGLFGLVGSSC